MVFLVILFCQGGDDIEFEELDVVVADDGPKGCPIKGPITGTVKQTAVEAYIRRGEGVEPQFSCTVQALSVGMDQGQEVLVLGPIGQE